MKWIYVIKSILRKKPIIHKWIKRRKRKEIFNVNYLIILAKRWVNENQNGGLSESSYKTCSVRPLTGPRELKLAVCVGPLVHINVLKIYAKAYL